MIRSSLSKFVNATALAACLSLTLSGCGNSDNPAVAIPPNQTEQDALTTATPIKHLVVIFGENVSFDHYFGTYPTSTNPSGEPTESWVAPAQTVENFNTTANASLLTANPNTTNAANLALGLQTSYLNPFRMDRAQFNASSQNHAYTAEQQAADNLKMDAFVAYTGSAGTLYGAQFTTKAQVMGYFDGNTVTAMWNYAQNYAMNDHAYTDSFGPSTPGAINVISGSTAGAKATARSDAANTSTAAVAGSFIEDGTNTSTYTVIGDPDPAHDKCATTTAETVQLTGKNIGDLLTAAKITWGGFMGGFDTTLTNDNGTTGCVRTTVSPHTSNTVRDYSPHHAWFQYYASSANINHTRPTSTALIGHNEANDAPNGATAVNHQYDYNDFVTAVSAGNYPSVSYLKAPAYQDGHPGNSNPLDEQTFVAKVLNFLMQQSDWKNTAVILAYDDSDGWYDHLAPTITNGSSDATADQVYGAGNCTAYTNGNTTTTIARAKGVDGATAINGRCGPGTRTPFIVISPYARQNYVDHTPITQASIIRFIEDNWLNGARLGGGSDDATAGSIMGMFDFSSAPRTSPYYINPTSGNKSATLPVT